jgi:hypothetical protein
MESRTIKPSLPEDGRAGRGPQAASKAAAPAASAPAFRGPSRDLPSVIRIGVARAPSRWLKPGGR